VPRRRATCSSCRIKICAAARCRTCSPHSLCSGDQTAGWTANEAASRRPREHRLRDKNFELFVFLFCPCALQRGLEDDQGIPHSKARATLDFVRMSSLRMLRPLEGACSNGGPTVPTLQQHQDSEGNRKRATAEPSEEFIVASADGTVSAWRPRRNRKPGPARDSLVTSRPTLGRRPFGLHRPAIVSQKV